MISAVAQSMIRSGCNSPISCHHAQQCCQAVKQYQLSLVCKMWKSHYIVHASPELVVRTCLKYDGHVAY